MQFSFLATTLEFGMSLQAFIQKLVTYLYLNLMYF